MVWLELLELAGHVVTLLCILVMFGWRKQSTLVHRDTFSVFSEIWSFCETCMIQMVRNTKQSKRISKANP